MQLPLYRTANVPWVVSLAFLLGLTIAIASPRLAPAAAAENYKQWEYNKDLKRKNGPQVGKMLINGTVQQSEQAMFDDYFEHFAVGRWTQPENRNALPNFRMELLKNLNQVKLGTAHNRLTDILLQMMSEAAFGNDFDPVVRVNAMLLIDDLNLEESPKSGTPPVPHPGAVPVLVRAVRDPKMIDPVKVAALTGLVRHASLGISSETAAADVTAAMLDLLRSKNVAGRSAAGYAWLQARAIDVLGIQANVGSNNAIADMLGNIAADANSQMLVRRAAAEALGKLNFQSAANLNAGKLATALGILAVAAVETAQEDREKNKPGAMPFMKSALYAALTAVTNLTNAPTAASQEKVAAVQTQLQQMRDVLHKGTDDSVVDTVAPMATELKAVLAKP